MININLTDEGKRLVTLTPLTKKGKPTTIDTQDRHPSVESIDGDTTGTLEVTPEGKLAVTVTHGTVPEGSNAVLHTLRVKADADRDAGEDREISEDIVVTLTRAEASNFSAEVGEEEEAEA